MASRTYPYRPFVCVRWGAHGSIGDIKRPTIEEVQSLVTLNDDFKLSDIVGWQVASENITDPNWGTFMSQRLGATQVEQSRLIFLATLAGIDIRKMLWRGKKGYVVIMPSGCHRLDAPMDIFPVQVSHVLAFQDLTQGAAKIDINFAVTRTPATDVFVPEVVG